MADRDPRLQDNQSATPAFLAFTPMNQEAAAAIAEWRYEGAYSVYNATPDQIAVLLDPRNRYLSVATGEGDLADFCCFGPDARVPGGKYDEEALDVGLGLRPDLTGRGLGPQFLDAILGFAQDEFGPAAFRLTVATFNRRAIRVYEKAGFRRVGVFTSKTDGGARGFVQMVRSA